MDNLNFGIKCNETNCGTDKEDNKDFKNSENYCNKQENTEHANLESTAKSSEHSDSINSCSVDGQKNVDNDLSSKNEVENSKGMLKEEAEKRTLVDYLSENMQAIVDGEMFAVIPLPWCPHLETLYAIPNNVRFEQGAKCIDCDHTDENWVCLHCYITACARSVNGHMQVHYSNTGHPLVLSLLDLSVWCNECDAYVDNALLYDAKNNAHRFKFNEDMPWCYARDTIHMQ